ncbi:F-box/kelch-repeat protein At3g23880-like [Rhododendron vialii]|uniref:F-box/kelch-repeat protein At3g23880-like n=1 Tax=Rhododendron vialii TaxID=182163 RepID=UPI00265D623C|nr:F-box/kelch-repeat protein At3g23880-like [Rhododendron vialii]
MAYENSSTSREPKKTKQTSQIPLSTEYSQPLLSLPPEITVEILSRLPVKSLLRLRCVCKSWRSLISNPKFAKTHLCRASMNTDYTNHRLIFSRLYPRTDVKSCSLYSIANRNSDSAVQLDCPLKDPNLQVTIWGCCDDLVCIGTEREVFIWNPSTRKYKRPRNVELSCQCYADAWFGFGYDEFIDDYKVVGFFFANRTNGFEPIVKVYSLRSDSWRRIEDCPRRVPRGTLGTFVNRALHWINLSASSGSKDIIVSLDFVKETYGEVSKPEYQDSNLKETVLGVLNGCLCILCQYSGACFHVWVMKEYGIRDSWTTLFVILYGPPPLYCPYSAPLCILENGEVLLNLATHTVRYKPKNGTFSFPEIHNCSPLFSAYIYIESLVSPDSNADSGVQWQHQQ